MLWCCPSSGTDCTLFCLTLAEVKKQRLRNISVFSYVCLLSTCDTIRTATNYLVDVFCRKYQSRVSVIKELALKWSCELWNLSFSMVYWDWLSQEAGTGPGCFHVATRILKVMESLTAVGRRIPCPDPMSREAQSAAHSGLLILHPSQLVPIGTMLPGQMAT